LAGRKSNGKKVRQFVYAVTEIEESGWNPIFKEVNSNFLKKGEVNRQRSVLLPMQLFTVKRGQYILI